MVAESSTFGALWCIFKKKELIFFYKNARNNATHDNLVCVHTSKDFEVYTLTVFQRLIFVSIFS